MTCRHISTPRAFAAALFALGTLACSGPTSEADIGRPADQSPDVEHVEVYFEKGRFGGWPANHGIWIWGNEILVGFTKG